MLRERKKKQFRNALQCKTSTEASLLEQYLQEISKIPVLSREDEVRLAREVQKGDQNARDALVRANLRFVVSVAYNFKSPGMSMIDLISEGNIGLLRAVEKFDPEMGFHFVSFAVWSIRQSISYAVHQKARLVRLPLNQSRQLMRIMSTKQSIEAEQHTEANLNLLADILDMKVKEVRRLLDISRAVVSLDQTDTANSPSEESITLLESITDHHVTDPEVILEEAEMKYQINKCLRKLSPQECEVLKMRFGIGRDSFSLKKIGQIIGLSRERIRQIEITAMHKLRTTKEGQHLQEYLKD